MAWRFKIPERESKNSSGQQVGEGDLTTSTSTGFLTVNTTFSIQIRIIFAIGLEI
jgi:hypothetical protein